MTISGSATPRSPSISWCSCVFSRAASIDYDVTVDAQPVGTVADTGQDADVILLGPQIRFNLAKVKGMCPDKPVEAMDIQAYGTMNGQKIIDRVKEILGD